MAKKKVLLKPEHLKRLVDADRRDSINVGGYYLYKPHKGVTRVWEELGRELGFDPWTIEPLGIPGPVAQFHAESTDEVCVDA